MGSLLFLWEVKRGEFGSLGRPRIVLKGLICFRLDALHILQLLEGSTGSRIGTARAKQGQCSVQWVHECGARSATRKGRGSIWVTWAYFSHQTFFKWVVWSSNWYWIEQSQGSYSKCRNSLVAVPSQGQPSACHSSAHAPLLAGPAMEQFSLQDLHFSNSGWDENSIYMSFTSLIVKLLTLHLVLEYSCDGHWR